MQSRRRTTSTSSSIRSSSATPPPPSPSLSSSPTPSSPRSSSRRRHSASVPRGRTRVNPSHSSGSSQHLPGRLAQPIEFAGVYVHSTPVSPHAARYSHYPEPSHSQPGPSFIPAQQAVPAVPQRVPRSQELLPSSGSISHPNIQLHPEDARRSRRSHGGRSLFLPSSRDVVLALPGGRTYSQSRHTGSSRSVNPTGTYQPVSRHVHPASSSSENENDAYLHEEQDTYQPDGLMSEIIISVGQSTESIEDRRARERAKRERQVTRWVQDVIPALCQPYLQLLRTSQSLRSVQRELSVLCNCRGEESRVLKVTCVYFDREAILRVTLRLSTEYASQDSRS